MRRSRTLLLAAGLVAAGMSPVAAPATEPAPLPPPSYPSVVQRDVLIAMDDGVELGATLTFPSADGSSPAPGPFPVVLTMTPYGRSTPLGGSGLEVILAERGIVAALVDVRGTGGSGGTLEENYFSPREARDGAIVVEWLAAQSWSTGRVAMTGGSYLGITQYLVASQQPPHLVAITPIVALSDLYREGWTHGGIPNGFFGAQYLAVQGAPGYAGTTNDPSVLGPTIKAKLGQQPPGFIAFDYLANPDDGPFYRDRSPITLADRIQVPVLIVGQWRDGLLRGAPEMYRVLAARPGVTTRLSIDPCTHKGCGAPFAPMTNPPGVQPLVELVFEFLNHYLTGAPLADRPPVRLYVQGANRYLDTETYPPPGATVTRLYPTADGGLGDAAPADERARPFVANPTDGYSMTLDRFGTVAISPYVPLDQRAETGRGLTWRTEPLAEPLTLAGPAAMHLVASSDRTDTDWHVKMSDVAPDGTESIITDGALRASHRALDAARSTPARPYHTHVDPQPLEPATVYDFEIEIWPTAYELALGHRLQIRVTSNDLPTHAPFTYKIDGGDPTPYAVRPNLPGINTVRLGGVNPTWIALTVLA